MIALLAGSAACGRARKVFCCEFVEILAPVLFAVAAELEEIVPGEDAGRMHVVEDEPHCVVADGMQLEDLHVALAGYGTPFARRVTLDLSARAAHAQIFGRQLETLAAVECDGEQRALLVQAQFSRPR